MVVVKTAPADKPVRHSITESPDEGADVGLDAETAVSDDYKEGDNKFTGKIAKVVIEVVPLKLGAADKEELRNAEAARSAAE